MTDGELFLIFTVIGIGYSWYQEQISPNRDFWDYYCPFCAFLTTSTAIICVLDFVAKYI